jgi:hypothetical protein
VQAEVAAIPHVTTRGSTSGLAARLLRRRKSDWRERRAGRGARLRFADGPSLEDSVDVGVVLFMSETPVQLPATVEIGDGTGSMLTSYEAFKGP